MNKRNPRFVWRFKGRGPNGRRLCVWCGTEVPKGKIRWCSEDCVHQMMIEYWPAVWRNTVIDRDKGICQICGFDARLWKRVYRNIWTSASNLPYGREREIAIGECHAAQEFMKRHMWNQGFKRGCELVEADHIIPVVEGGQNKLDNGRTLCVPCHKQMTAELAARLKWDRRAKKNGLLFAMLKIEAAPRAIADERAGGPQEITENDCKPDL